MKGFYKYVRLLNLIYLILRHGFNRNLVLKKQKVLFLFTYLNPFSFFNKKTERNVAVRQLLELLGPIFIKFGQVLSTRSDVLSPQLAKELGKLQDRVPPFPTEIAIKRIESIYKKPIKQLFPVFSTEPIASASIAQVYAAQLPDGSDVVVKLVRPHIKKIICRDVGLLYLLAKVVPFFWRKARRLNPKAFVAEFEQTLLDELDLTREGAHASQLKRNFGQTPNMYVPKIFWSYAKRDVLVLERIHGYKLNELKPTLLKEGGYKRLAELLVQTFFTQVFRDNFFHADMHPGNLFVSLDKSEPVINLIDFGIMGTLSQNDQYYLAENFVAFFKRDYRRVTTLHIDSGWVAADTRVDQFESAIRAVCEPVFEMPLKDISFAQLLLRLFQTAERFDMKLQPQLMLLQKTLLNVEGLARQLYCDLDLWETAYPILKAWVKKRHGLGSLCKTAVDGYAEGFRQMVQMPGLAHEVLQRIAHRERSEVSLVKPQSSCIIKRFLYGVGVFCFLTSGFDHFVFSSALYHGMAPVVFLTGSAFTVFAGIIKKK